MVASQGQAAPRRHMHIRHSHHFPPKTVSPSAGRNFSHNLIIRNYFAPFDTSHSTSTTDYHPSRALVSNPLLPPLLLLFVIF